MPTIVPTKARWSAGPQELQILGYDRLASTRYPVSFFVRERFKPCDEKNLLLALWPLRFYYVLDVKQRGRLGQVEWMDLPHEHAAYCAVVPRRLDRLGGVVVLVKRGV